MVSEKLKEIWKRKGLFEKLEEQGIKTSSQPILNNTSKLKVRAFGSLKGGGITRTFRPTNEVDSILLQISKGRISKFINRAILETYQRDKEETEG